MEHLSGQPPDDPVSAAPAPPPDVVPLKITADMLAPVDRRVDFEQGMSYLPRLTLGLIVACIGVFIWELAIGAMISEQTMIDAGALWREAVLKGEIWRPVTAMFLHGGYDHLIGNCFVLYVLGMANEHAFGTGRTGLIYLLSGIGGAILSLIFTPGPSVGASGAIFGLSASATVFLYRHQHHFYVRDKRIGFVLLVWACYTIATGVLDPQVDNYCHIGGFITGAMLGAVLPGRERDELKRAFEVMPIQPSRP